jgi:phosphatidylglycerol:prolipoprotein diacylglycerol transferase
LEQNPRPVIVHSLFDFLAWFAAALVAWRIRRAGWLAQTRHLTLTDHPGYFIALSLGAIAGAFGFGSLNLDLAGQSLVGHSIAGAIFGGIVAVELFKLADGITGSTGLRLVAPLALGIAVGRWGCFFAGLPDYTFGVPTTLPWGVDFGDGITRHPVQLYESFAMLAFLGVFLAGIAARSPLFLRQGFYLFVGWYGVQRFVWEFLKPYPAVLGPLNLFHLACLALVTYSMFMLWRPHDAPARG